MENLSEISVSQIKQTNQFKNSKPSTQYWNLFRLSEEILRCCERNNIQIWAEFGTLIGLKRHHGIIPWDYDGDFGVWWKDRQRFLDAFAKEKSDDVTLDVNWYNDEGTLGIYMNGNDKDAIDIVFYEDVDFGVNSKQNATTKTLYPSADGYCYKREDFHPLVKTTFIGHQIWIPNHIDNSIKCHYDDWRQIPKQYIDYIDPRFVLNKMVKPLPRHESINTFSELVNLLQSSPIPFILTQTKLLDCTQEKFSEMIQKQKAPIYGYSNSINWDKVENTGPQIWEAFRSGKLPFNIVDSPIEDKSLLTNEWQTYANQKLGSETNFALTWVLTNAPQISHFHTDPKYAGGFMKLLNGEKIWWCVEPKDLYFLLNKGHTVSSLSKLNMWEIIQLEDCYLYGKIYIDVIKDGDLIWFPIDTLHKVLTNKDSFGFGGYL